MPDFMTIGRTTSGSPARYVGGKYALYVSAMDNELGLAEWKCEDESASRFPLPTASECEGARTAVLALSVTLGACSESRRTILEMWESARAELDAINSHLRDFGGGDDSAYARVLSLHGAYIQVRGLLLELAEATQPPDMPHADLTPLHRLHMKVNEALARG